MIELYPHLRRGFIHLMKRLGEGTRDMGVGGWNTQTLQGSLLPNGKRAGGQQQALSRHGEGHSLGGRLLADLAASQGLLTSSDEEEEENVLHSGRGSGKRPWGAATGAVWSHPHATGRAGIKGPMDGAEAGVEGRNQVRE
ncbi:unnamed protein product, partial [Discosporangium mesarthrocarpum]